MVKAVERMDIKGIRADICAIFAARLRALRRSSGMTQEEFAGLLGTSKQVISRYELGQRCPPLAVAVDFAWRLGVPLETLTSKPPDR